MKIGFNGTVCEDKDAVISVYDHGFLYGMGLFETFRTYGGKPFLLQEHLDRLMEGCRTLGITYHTETPEVMDMITNLLQINQLPDAYFRLSVSAGNAGLGLTDQDYGEPNVIIYVKPLAARDPSLYEQGKPLQLLRLRRNTPEGEVRMKSFHYMNNVLAKREMKQYAGAENAEGLFLTEAGYLAEGIVSSLFYINNQTCFTPALSTGILPGITRAFVIRIANELSLKVVEGNYRWEDLLDADEIFIANSIQELVPVNKLYDEQGRSSWIGQGGAGFCTLRLTEKYHKYTQQQEVRE